LPLAHTTRRSLARFKRGARDESQPALGVEIGARQLRRIDRPTWMLRLRKGRAPEGAALFCARAGEGDEVCPQRFSSPCIVELTRWPIVSAQDLLPAQRVTGSRGRRAGGVGAVTRRLLFESAACSRPANNP